MMGQMKPLRRRASNSRPFYPKSRTERLKSEPLKAIAAEKQYNFVKLLYDDENAREKQLNEASKNLISLTAVYSGFLLAASQHLKPVDVVETATVVSALVAMLLGLIFAMRASAMANYEAIHDAEEVAYEYEDRPTEDTYFDDRLANLVVASKRNSIVNDTKANKLQAAGYMMVFGIAMHGVFFLLRLRWGFTHV